jgi:NADH:ubiquinone oxidoreductase subunit 6 (subunit J)
MAAVYLLLPRAQRFPPGWGVLLGGVTLVLAGAVLLNRTGLSVETVLFYAFSGLAVVGGAMMLAHSNPVYAALSFALVVLSTCGLFLLLAAPFLMAATLIIYAGAIIVTFLFVIMLAQQWGFSDADLRSREPFFAALTGFLLLGALLFVLQKTYHGDDPAKVRKTQEYVGEVRNFVARTKKAGEAANGTQVRAAFDNDKGAVKRFEDHLRLSEAGEKAEAEGATNDPPEKTDLVMELSEFDVNVVWNNLFEPGGGEPSAENLKALKAQLRSLHAKAQKYLSRLEDRATPGVLVPDRSRLSKLSDSLARDESGRPRLPASNVAALGRSLYGDYLLPVQLAAALLLVATIGAIAIAGRRTEGLR